MDVSFGAEYSTLVVCILLSCESVMGHCPLQKEYFSGGECESMGIENYLEDHLILM